MKNRFHEIDAEVGTIDFSLLELKPKHENKPLWVCPNFHIFLDTSSRYYEQVFHRCSVFMYLGD